MVLRLIDKLVEVGALRDTALDDTGPVTEDVIAHYRHTLAYLECFHDSPTQAFGRLIDAQILLIGKGPALGAAVRGLTSFAPTKVAVIQLDERPPSHSGERSVTPRGLKEAEVNSVVLSPAASSEDLAALMLDADIVVSIQPDCLSLRALVLNRYCWQTHKPFLSAGNTERGWYIGPLTVPGTPGCYECLAAIMLTSRRDPDAANLGAFTPPSIDRWSVADAVAGHTVAFQVLNYLTRTSPLQSEGDIIFVDSGSLSTSRHPLFAHPACGNCGSADGEVPFAWPLVTSDEDQKSFLSWAEPYADSHTGVVSVFVEDLVQLPLGRCRVQTRARDANSPATSPVLVVAQESETAVYWAFREGLAIYADKHSHRGVWLDPIGWRDVLDPALSDVVCAHGHSIDEALAVGLLRLGELQAAGELKSGAPFVSDVGDIPPEAWSYVRYCLLAYDIDLYPQVKKITSSLFPLLSLVAIELGDLPTVVQAGVDESEAVVRSLLLATHLLYCSQNGGFESSVGAAQVMTPPSLRRSGLDWERWRERQLGALSSGERRVFVRVADCDKLFASRLIVTNVGLSSPTSRAEWRCAI